MDGSIWSYNKSQYASTFERMDDRELLSLHETLHYIKDWMIESGVLKKAIFALLKKKNAKLVKKDDYYCCRETVKLTYLL